MVKLSDQNINLGLRSKKVIDQSTSDIYYCQRCGQELDLSDDQCVRCGKNTDEEKNLVS